MARETRTGGAYLTALIAGTVHQMATLIESSTRMVTAVRPATDVQENTVSGTYHARAEARAARGA